MSDQETTETQTAIPAETEPAAEAVPTASQPEQGETEATPDEADTEEGAGRESAKYRRRLRTAEAQRDELAGQLEVMRRAELARLAVSGDGPRLYAADDVFREDFDVGQVLDDAGRVDPEKVRGVIEEATTERRHLRADFGPRPPRPDRSQGTSGNPAPAPSSPWSEVIRGR